MKKYVKWILVIISFLVLLYLLSFFGLFSSSKPSEDEIVYYKDGKRVTSASGALCSSFYGSEACEMYGGERYYFTADFGSSHPRIHENECIQEFEERIGKKLEGYCNLWEVYIEEGVIKEYSCDCWSN
ncbi:MAG: hypothetical protein Q8O84_00360 [Nanoarchaeota archaeon]|nr:hypothetical protein [Nanoarchaeota archaeon]